MSRFLLLIGWFGGFIGRRQKINSLPLISRPLEVKFPKKCQSHFLGMGRTKGQVAVSVLICWTGRFFVWFKDPQEAQLSYLLRPCSQTFIRAFSARLSRMCKEKSPVWSNHQEPGKDDFQSAPNTTWFYLTIFHKPNQCLRAEKSINAQNFFNHCAEGRECRGKSFLHIRASAVSRGAHREGKATCGGLVPTQI